MPCRCLSATLCLLCLLAGCSQERPEGQVCLGFCPNDDGPTVLLPETDEAPDETTARSPASAMVAEGLAAEIRSLMLERTKAVPLGVPERALADLPRAEDGRVHVLALSSGGPFGAFGAGFLNGWSEQPEGALERPEAFDVVTGVSAGALLATFAFLGPDRDDDLRRQYTTIGTEDVFKERSLFRALFSNALFDTAPLRATLEGLVTDDLLNEVADATSVSPDDGMPKRFLLVLAVNLDSGLPRLFDLGAIARDRSAADRASRYVDALMASAAIPVAFPPVFIDGDMHVDGGARLALFFNRFMEEQRALIDERDVPAPMLDIIVNSEVTLEPSCTGNTLAGIGGRSLDVVLNQITLDSLYRAISEAERDGADVRYATAEGSGCEAPDDPTDPFDPAFLRCLFAFGKALGSGDQPFSKGLDAFPRQTIGQDSGPPLSCVTG